MWEEPEKFTKENMLAAIEFYRTFYSQKFGANASNGRRYRVEVRDDSGLLKDDDVIGEALHKYRVHYVNEICDMLKESVENMED